MSRPRRARWPARISAATARSASRRLCAGIGTGEMEPLWDRLGELQMPVLVVVGDRDEKFRALGRAARRQIAAHGRLLVVPGGHGLPLETRPARRSRRRSARSGSTPRPGAVGTAICRPGAGSGSSSSSNSPSVASPHGASGPREASAAAACTAAAIPSGPSSVEAR